MLEMKFCLGESSLPLGVGSAWQWELKGSCCGLCFRTMEKVTVGLRLLELLLLSLLLLFLIQLIANGSEAFNGIQNLEMHMTTCVGNW